MTIKNVGLRIRVNKELRQAFQDACSAQNRCASEVLRDFMQVFADKSQGGSQADLFVAPAERKPRHSTKGNAI